MWGIGSRTDFSHIYEMFDDANMRSGLYPFWLNSINLDWPMINNIATEKYTHLLKKYSV